MYQYQTDSARCVIGLTQETSSIIHCLPLILQLSASVSKQFIKRIRYLSDRCGQQQQQVLPGAAAAGGRAESVLRLAAVGPGGVHGAEQSRAVRGRPRQGQEGLL